MSPLPYIVLAVLVAGALIWFGRGRGLRVPAALLAITSLAATVVGWADFSATPDGGGNPLLWALAAYMRSVIVARMDRGYLTTQHLNEK